LIRPNLEDAVPLQDNYDQQFNQNLHYHYRQSLQNSLKIEVSTDIMQSYSVSYSSETDLLLLTSSLVKLRNAVPKFSISLLNSSLKLSQDSCLFAWNDSIFNFSSEFFFSNSAISFLYLSRTLFLSFSMRAENSAIAVLFSSIFLRLYCRKHLNSATKSCLAFWSSVLASATASFYVFALSVLELQPESAKIKRMAYSTGDNI